MIDLDTPPWAEAEQLEEDRSEPSVDLFAHRGKTGKEVRKVPKGTVEGELDAELGYVPPKGDEIQKIVDVLEENDFATYKDMAKHLHKMLFSMVRNREWWTLYRGGYSFEGLEPTEGAIRRWGAKRFHPNMPLRFAKITGEGILVANEEAMTAEILADEARAAFWRGGICEECGHLGEMHVEFLQGRPKPDDKNQPGKCTAPLPAGPRRAGSGSKGQKTCGCDYALKQGVRR